MVKAHFILKQFSYEKGFPTLLLPYITAKQVYFPCKDPGVP